MGKNAKLEAQLSEQRMIAQFYNRPDDDIPTLRVILKTDVQVGTTR